MSGAESMHTRPLPLNASTIVPLISKFVYVPACVHVLPDLHAEALKLEDAPPSALRQNHGSPFVHGGGPDEPPYLSDRFLGNHVTVRSVDLGHGERRHFFSSGS